MILQVNGGVTPSPTPADLVSIASLLLITITLIVSYYAYRTQHLSTKILDAKSYIPDEGIGILQSDFLIKNMSHTSHVVLRVKLKVYPPNSDEAIDMREICLAPQDSRSKLHYLYPSRSGTSKMPGLKYRVELGPLDFTRFRTFPPGLVVAKNTAGDIIEYQKSPTVVNLIPQNIDDLNDIDKARFHYDYAVQNTFSEPEEHEPGERPFPPYIIPRNIRQIRLEVQQTGEVYELVRVDDSRLIVHETEWSVMSKMKCKVLIDGNEYSMGRPEYSLWNFYYFLRYKLVYEIQQKLDSQESG